jgi:hypothetical protein
MTKDIDIETMIQAFAKFKRIKKADMPEFRAIIMKGLDQMGLDNKIDYEKYRQIAKQKR